MGVGQRGSTKLMIVHLPSQPWGISQKTSIVLLLKLHNTTFISITKYKISPSLGWKVSTVTKGNFSGTYCVSQGDFFETNLLINTSCSKNHLPPTSLSLNSQTRKTLPKRNHNEIWHILRHPWHTPTQSAPPCGSFYRLLNQSTRSGVVRIKREKTATSSRTKKQAFIGNSRPGKVT